VSIAFRACWSGIQLRKAGRQPPQIVKVPEIDPTAPVVALLEKIMHYPVQGAGICRRDHRPQAVAFAPGGGLGALRPGLSKLQHTDVLPARHAALWGNWDVSQHLGAAPRGREFRRVDADVQIARDPARKAVARAYEDRNGALEQDRTDPGTVQRPNGFVELGAQPLVPVAIAGMEEAEVLGCIRRRPIKLPTCGDCLEQRGR
jgi:hypothetical protein